MSSVTLYTYSDCFLSPDSKEQEGDVYPLSTIKVFEPVALSKEVLDFLGEGNCKSIW